jgi:hypothetical protein
MSRRLLLLAAMLAAAAGCYDDDLNFSSLDNGMGTEADPFRFETTLQPFFWSGTAWGAPLEAEPNGEWALNYALDVDLTRHKARFGDFEELIVAVYAEMRHDADGAFRSGMGTIATTHRLTTTGIPIERFNGWPTLLAVHGKDGTPFEAIQVHPLLEGRARHTVQHLEGRLVVNLPADTPVGWYRPRILIFARVEGVRDPIMIDNFGDNANTQDEQVLPLVRVGPAKTPRLPLMLATLTNYRGQVGILPEEDLGRVALVSRAGFPRTFILPPGMHEIAPQFPSLSPEASIAAIDGGYDVIPAVVRHYLDLSEGMGMEFVVYGPDGQVVPITPPPSDLDDNEGYGWKIDLSQTGEYTVRLTARMKDRFGRDFEGGGTYRLWSARALSFSTSVKPGTPFLVGETYPAKVNINPPLPAQVEVRVDYFPNSDPTRKVTWTGRGTANRYGHFVPYDTPPLRFEEPGEYHSTVTATYRDGNGTLWMGEQTSSSVIAPVEPGAVRLHGTRSSPYNLKPDGDWMGAVTNFDKRIDAHASFLPFKPGAVPDTFVPYAPGDTLFVQSNGFKESIIEPHVSIGVDDPALAKRLREGLVHSTVMPPPTLQLALDTWSYLHDVVQISADSAAWFPADEAHSDELPIAPLGSGRYHPFNFPENNRLDAYVYLGVVRPGFPVMTAAFESDAIGLYWLASPNRFGGHFNTSDGGDLPGDFYRVQAGVVIKDHETGLNHYDAYGSTIAVAPRDGAATGIVRPGERPLIETMGRNHYIFFGQDTHDTLEVGEIIGLGGMVAPAVRADLHWRVTKPDGEQIDVRATANRLGIARGRPLIPVDQPGLYRVTTTVTWEDLSGDIVGTSDGSFFHCAVPAGPPADLLQTTLGALTRVDPEAGVAIELTWPNDLEDAELHFGVIMPGRVLDDGVIVGDPDHAWTYRFSPLQIAAQHSNYDVRNFRTGELELVDMVVFQFFLQGMRDGEMVYDSLRLAMRGEQLWNYEAFPQER